MELDSKYSKKIGNILANISEEDRAVFTTKKFAGSYQLPVLIKKLRNLALYDLYADRMKGIYMKRAIVVAVITFAITFLIFFSFAGGFIARKSLFLAFFLPLFLVLASIVLVRKSKTLKKNDLNNEFRNFLVPLFATLGEDIMPKSKVFVDAIFDAPMQDKYSIGEKKPGSDFELFVKAAQNPNKSGKSIYNYHQNWITANMLFVDQVHLSFVIERAGSKIYSTKKRSSGKVKTKSKTKMRINIHLQMLVPKSHYKKSGQLARSKDARHSMQMNLEDQDGNLLIKAKYKRKGMPNDRLSVQEFLSLIRAMYATIQPI